MEPRRVSCFVKCKCWLLDDSGKIHKAKSRIFVKFNLFGFDGIKIMLKCLESIPKRRQAIIGISLKFSYLAAKEFSIGCFGAFSVLVEVVDGGWF